MAQSTSLTVADAPTGAGGSLRSAAQVAVIVGAFVVFCTYLPSYLFLVGHTSINPGAVVVAFFMLALGVWLATSRRVDGPVTLVCVWAAAFVAMNMVTLAIHGPGVELNQRVAGALSLLLLYWFVLPDRVAPSLLQKVLLAYAVFNLACVAIDFFRPGLFVPEGSPYYNEGRGAGLFVNANKSGIAAVFVLVMASFTERSRLFVVILMVCAAWVLLTVSRSSILGYAIVCLGLLATGKLRVRDLILPLAAGVTLAVGAIVYLVAAEGPGVASIEERAEWLTSGGKVTDFAADERTTAAVGALKAFVDQPVVGNGFGSADRLHGLPAHNLYLQFAADYGVLGAWFIAAFLAAMVIDWRRAGAPPQLRAPLVTWVCATAVLSFFFDEAIGITQFMFVAAWFQRQLVTLRRPAS